MNYLKSLALALLSISILTSCSEDEYFSNDIYSQEIIKASENNTKANENDANSVQPNDTTNSGTISVLINEPYVEDIDYVITLP